MDSSTLTVPGQPAPPEQVWLAQLVPKCHRCVSSWGPGASQLGLLSPGPLSSVPHDQVCHQQFGTPGGGRLHDRVPEWSHPPAEDARHRLVEEVLPDD